MGVARRKKSFKGCVAHLHRGGTVHTQAEQEQVHKLQSIIPFTATMDSGQVYDKPSRQITLSFPCRDIEIPQPIAANEKAYCHYEVTMPCQYGCPKVLQLNHHTFVVLHYRLLKYCRGRECAVVDRKLCAGHGICEYDYSNKRAHCFCDRGWKGHACSGMQDHDTAVLCPRSTC